MARVQAKLGGAVLAALYHTSSGGYAWAKGKLMSALGTTPTSSKRGLCCFVGSAPFQALAATR